MASKGEELWKKYKSGGDSDITPSSSASTTSTKNNAVERWNKWKQDNSTLGSRVQESGSDLFDRYNHVIERASVIHMYTLRISAGKAADNDSSLSCDE